MVSKQLPTTQFFFRLSVHLIMLAILITTHGPVTHVSAAPVQQTGGGAKRIINLLCKFPDQAGEPGVPTTIQRMFFDNPNPDLDSYIQEMSYDAANLQGTQTGPQVYPLQNQSSYIPGGTDVNKLAAACINAANPDVDFRNYEFITLFTNGRFPDFSGKVFSYQATLDGVSKVYSVIIFNYRAALSPALVAHELGHAFGMGPHPAATGYDPLASALLGDPNCVFAPGPGFSAPSRAAMSWLPANRVLTWAGGTQRITLARLTQPGATGYLQLKVMLPGGSGEYSIEYRTFVGYDTQTTPRILGSTCGLPSNTNLANEAVVIQKMNNSPEFTTRKAGETFTDAANALSIKVVSTNANEAVIELSGASVPLAPTNLQRGTVSGTNLPITWTDNATSETEYRVGYITDSDYGYGLNLMNTAANATTVTLNGLNPNEQYAIEVKACNIQGCSAAALLRRVSLKAAAPTNLRLATVTANSVQILWNDSAEETNYDLWQGTGLLSNTGQCPAQGMVHIGRFPANITSYTFAGLTSNTTYCFAVQSINNLGSGTQSGINATPGVAPQNPTPVPTTVPPTTLPPTAVPTAIPTSAPNSTWINELNGTTLRPQDLPGFCLNLNNNQAGNSAMVNLSTCNGSNGQKWVRHGDQSIRPKDHATYCLNLHSNANHDGNTINLWSCTGHNSQKWVADSNHNLHPQDYPQRCLNVNGNAGYDRNVVNLWTCSGHNSQKWHVIADEEGASVRSAMAVTAEMLSLGDATTLPVSISITAPITLPITEFLIVTTTIPLSLETVLTITAPISPPIDSSDAPIEAKPASEETEPTQKLFLPIINLAGTAFGNEEMNPILLALLLIIGVLLVFWLRRSTAR